MIQTDWLGFNAVFYNEKTNKISSNINNVIDFKNLEFDENGLNEYLDYGYSIFGYTPIKHVKFTLPNTKIDIINNKIIIEELEDPVLNFIESVSKIDETLEIMREQINKWIYKNNKKIIVPTSAGYDSRLLNLLINKKELINAFTYGVSTNSSQSYEVILAKKLCEILNISWDEIKLGNFHIYNDYWYNLFGVSTHLHGMYHVEFYNKIIEKTGINSKVLSGIIGGAWCGAKIINPINSPDDVRDLGNFHDMGLLSKYSLIKRTSNLSECFYEKHKDLLKNPRYRIIARLRKLIMLLKYLITIPESLELESWSPFIELDVCMSLLCIDEDRENRLWLKKIFTKYNINVEDMELISDTTNNLDLNANKIMPLEPINKKLLGRFLNIDYLDYVEKIENEMIKYDNKIILLPLQKLLEKNDTTF